MKDGLPMARSSGVDLVVPLSWLRSAFSHLPCFGASTRVSITSREREQRSSR